MNQQQVFNMRLRRVRNHPRIMAQVHIWFENLPAADPRRIEPLIAHRQRGIRGDETPMERLQIIASNLRNNRRAQFPHRFRIWLNDPVSNRYKAKERWHEFSIINKLKYNLARLHEEKSGWRLMPGAPETVDDLRKFNPDAEWPAKYDHFNPLRPGGPEALQDMRDLYDDQTLEWPNNFGKRNKSLELKRLQDKSKKLKIRITKKVRGKRVYKTVSELKRAIKLKLKK